MLGKGGSLKKKEKKNFLKIFSSREFTVNGYLKEPLRGWNTIEFELASMFQISKRNYRISSLVNREHINNFPKRSNGYETKMIFVKKFCFKQFSIADILLFWMYYIDKIIAWLLRNTVVQVFFRIHVRLQRYL